MTILKFFAHIIIIVLLTVITQVGGLIWILALFISRISKIKTRWIFSGLYLLCLCIVVPLTAPIFGRTALPVFDDDLKPRNWFYPLTFRNYVVPELRDQLIVLSKNQKDVGTEVTYLDANFPFFDAFPLLPHISHNDGKKIDLSFQYKTIEGLPTDKKPSVSGYGIFVNTALNDTRKTCLSQGLWQYDINSYMSFGTINNLEFDEIRTKSLILDLLSDKQSEKLFIEPYFKTQLGLQNNSKVRFHGCHAVRHDDHIHYQIR